MNQSMKNRPQNLARYLLGSFKNVDVAARYLGSFETAGSGCDQHGCADVYNLTDKPGRPCVAALLHFLSVGWIENQRKRI